MRVRETVPKVGDWYPTVRAWMQRLGATELDQMANATKLTANGCRIYVSAVMGPTFSLRFRKMSSSHGRGGRRYITLERLSVENGSMNLGTVLHECAHAICQQRDDERRRIRRKRMKKTRTYRPPIKHVERGHGEIFCRVYARLLREVML